MASRLIRLDKNPELRPIGVGEVLMRIIGKVVMTNLKDEIINSVGSFQACTAHEAVCEIAVHVMQRRTQNPVEPLRWSVLRKQLTAISR